MSYYGRHLDKRLSKQDQPNVLVHLFILTLIKLKVIHESSRYPYVNDKGKRGNYSISSSNIGGHLRLKWKRQDWYKFQSKNYKDKKDDSKIKENNSNSNDC